MNLRIRSPRALLVALALGLLTAAAAGTALAAETPVKPVDKPAADIHKNLFDLIKEGGWVMFPIGACSVLTVYLIGDGILRTMHKRIAPPAHVAAVKDFFRQGDYVGAYQYCKANPSPVCDVLRVGTGLLGDGKHVVEEGMMGELAKVNGNMQTYISYLSVIGVCTPMIGLLGTVTGMIKAFATLGTSGIGDPGQLAGAIGEVLVATAGGLLIAIPAFGAFYFLRNRAQGAINHVSDILNSLFRKMPYEALQGVHIGDEELFAAVPNWVAAPAAIAATDHPAPVADPLSSQEQLAH